MATKSPASPARKRSRSRSIRCKTSVRCEPTQAEIILCRERDDLVKANESLRAELQKERADVASLVQQRNSASDRADVARNEIVAAHNALATVADTINEPGRPPRKMTLAERCAHVLACLQAAAKERHQALAVLDAARAKLTAIALYIGMPMEVFTRGPEKGATGPTATAPPGGTVSASGTVGQAPTNGVQR